MCLGDVKSILGSVMVDQLLQCSQLARNVLQCNGLQFGPSLQCLKERSTTRLYGLATMGKTINNGDEPTAVRSGLWYYFEELEEGTFLKT